MRVLSDYRRCRLLEPFVEEPRSMASAARILGRPINSLFHHIQTFVKLGLLEVASIKPRHGRAIKNYRTTGDAFFVPFTALREADLVEHLEKRDAELWSALYRNAALVYQAAGNGREWGRRHFWNNGRFEAHTGPAPDDEPFEILDHLAADATPAFLLSWETANLDRRRAKDFQRELIDLIRRYGGEEDSDGDDHLFHLAMVPLREPIDR